MGKNKNNNSRKNTRQKGTGKERAPEHLVAKLIAVAAIAVAAVAATDHNRLFVTDEYYKLLSYKRWETFYRTTDHGNYDILLIGNSHVYNGINPDYLSQRTGKSCFILADASLSVKDNYFALEEALERCRPKVVVLETFGLLHVDVGKGSNTKPSSLAFNARRNAWLKLGSMFSLFDVEDCLPAWSTTLRNHQTMLQSPEKMKEAPAKYRGVVEADRRPYHGEYVRYATGMTDSTVALYDSLGSPDDSLCWGIRDEAMKYLRKTAELCQSRKIRLVLLTVPMYPPSAPGYAEGRARAEEGIAGLGLPWLDLQQPYDTATFTPDCFEDNYTKTTHMSYRGSLLASELLGQFLATNIFIR